MHNQLCPAPFKCRNGRPCYFTLRATFGAGTVAVEVQVKLGRHTAKSFANSGGRLAAPEAGIHTRVARCEQ